MGAAWDAARGAAGGPRRVGTRRGTRRGPRRGARRGTRRGARDAAWALLVRDLIGDGFTQEQYDLLTGPWRKTVGPLHPDDVDLRAAESA